jgi:hypothetical protein
LVHRPLQLLLVVSLALRRPLQQEDSLVPRLLLQLVCSVLLLQHLLD